MDPFNIREGELIIAESHLEFGAAHGHYEEFRFFTGLRQSEQIALTTADCDLVKGKSRIMRARVRGRWRYVLEKTRIRYRDRYNATNLPPDEGWRRPSWRKYSQRDGGADGTRKR